MCQNFAAGPQNHNDKVILVVGNVVSDERIKNEQSTAEYFEAILDDLLIHLEK